MTDRQVPSLRLFKEKITELKTRFNGLGNASGKNYTDTVREGSNDLVTSDAVARFIRDNMR